MVNMLHTTATPNTITFTNNMRSDASMVQYDNTDFFRGVSTNTAVSYTHLDVYKRQD